MSNHYEVPKWAGKPPTGFHLDVLKEDKLIQKLMIDEKKCYLFGRNSQLNDFCIDHQSCSRVHAAYVYHKHLHISYLVDLGSTHGTFIGNVRLESHKPTQLHMNSQFHFGASTRSYILRERPTTGVRPNIMEDIPMSDVPEGALLPESQSELDNLTEYNTATNRRISMLGIADDTTYKSQNLDKDKANRKRLRKSVTFNDDEIVINPEDIDPTIGRFRNLIQTTVVPTKKAKMDIGIPTSASSSVNDSTKHHLHPTNLVPHLYHGLPPTADEGKFSMDVDEGSAPLSLGSKLGLMLPNPAPDVLPTNAAETSEVMPPPQSASNRLEEPETHTGDEPKKKKYAKEAWPGRKPLMSGL